MKRQGSRQMTVLDNNEDGKNMHVGNPPVDCRCMYYVHRRLHAFL